MPEINTLGPVIKSTYESEPDTNAFTDLEKSKLAGIQTGAEVNVVDSVNGEIGVIVLDTSDINDSADKRYVTDSELLSLQNISTDYVSVSQKGAANGVAPLGSDSKLDVSFLPYAVLGAAIYQGTWNANTNTPEIVSGTGTKGHYYVVDTNGTTEIDGIDDWKLGDWIIFNGDVWQKVDNTDAVISVAGKIGAVTLDKSDVGLNNVDNTSDLSKPVSTATQTALDGKVSSNVTGISGADQVTNLVSLTQAEYNAIGAPNASTLYVITNA